MVDEELIKQSYTVEQKGELAIAFKILHQTGLFQLQVAENIKRIVSGFNTDQSESDLAKEILQVRQTNRQLLALHELAAKLKEGME